MREEASVAGGGGLRAGQSAFNRLAEIAPELADSIRGGPDDPYYDDSRLERFRQRLAQAGVSSI